MLRNRSLDEALQATLADLRRANADLQASRRRLVTTADAERKRIERDLHDGAQQHLVALAVGIRLVRDSLAACAPPADIELLDELDRGVRESIGSLRDLAHGIYPPLLRDSGLEEALRAAAKRSPLAVTVSATDLGRHPEQVEAAVYFCCLEALANAGKHAPGATVTITLQAVPGELRFEVADAGPGFDPRPPRPARGCRTWPTGSGRWAARSRGARRRGTARSSSAAPRCPASRPSRPRVRPCRWGTEPWPVALLLGAVGLVARAELRTRWRGLVALGLLFGLVGGIVLGTVAVADRTVTAYERLAAAIGVADAQVLLPAAHETVFDQVADDARGDRELDTGRLDRPDQHPGRPVRLAQRRPRPPAGPRRAGRRSRAGHPAPTRPTRSSSASRPPRTWACTSATR